MGKVSRWLRKMTLCFPGARLVSQGGGEVTASGDRQNWPARKIQKVFRDYLARRTAVDAAVAVAEAALAVAGEETIRGDREKWAATKIQKSGDTRSFCQLVEENLYSMDKDFQELFSSFSAVNKQLNDKESFAAAAKNPSFRQLLDQCLQLADEYINSIELRCIFHPLSIADEDEVVYVE